MFVRRAVFLLCVCCLSASGIFVQNSISDGGAELLSDSINKVGALSVGQKVVIPGFYFDAGSSDVNANLKDYIKKIAASVKKTKYKKIVVEAYTDNSGSEEMNKRLSTARAKAVRDEFKKNGISVKKMSYFGRGQLKPVADNRTKSGRVQNRRIEIAVQ